MSMPSQTDEKLSLFDRFATAADTFVSRSWFFLACLLLVALWIPTFFAVPDVDTWQLLINTPTTVITFLLVALQSNTNKRADAALQTKLNAIAVGLVYQLNNTGGEGCAQELRQAVGLEDKEST